MSIGTVPHSSGVPAADHDQQAGTPGMSPQAKEQSRKPVLSAAESAQRLSRNALLLRTGFILALVLLWELAARIELVDPRFASQPTLVLSSMAELATDTAIHTAVLDTLMAFVVAFVIGTGSGLLCGVVFGFFPLLREAYFPFVTMFMAVPKSVFLPLIVLFFGLGREPGMAFGALMSFVYVTVNVVAGLDLIEKRYLLAARAYGAGPWRTFIDVLVPGATPGIFAGIWHGIRNSFIGVINAQLFVSSVGIGYLVRLYTNNFQINHAMALVLATAALVIVMASIWNRLESRLTVWRQ